MKLTLNRGELLTGEALRLFDTDYSPSAQLHHAESGLFCCLGVYLRDVCGKTPESMGSAGMPLDAYLAKDLPEWLQGHAADTSKKDARDIAGLNDASPDVHPKDREEGITKLFLQLSDVDEVEWVGDYAEGTRKMRQALGLPEPPSSVAKFASGLQLDDEFEPF